MVTKEIKERQSATF
jgi:hypothetical protein